MIVYLLLPLGLAIFAAGYLRRGGEVKTTPGRAVKHSLGRSLALLLLIAATIDLITVLGFGSYVYASLIALAAVLVIGLGAAVGRSGHRQR